MRIIIVIFFFLFSCASVFFGQVSPCKSISEGLNSPEEIIVLDLHQPKRISKQIKLFTNLEELDIYMPRFRKLPKEIGQLKKLKTIIITGTQDSKIKKIPPELGQLNQLTWLRIWNVELKKLPDEIGKLDKLEKLELFANNLKVLPKEIIGLTELKKIGIGSNPELNFFDSFEKLSVLPQLTYLNINYYPHDTLPGNIAKLQQLETITIWGNKNSKLDIEHCIQYFSKLKRIKKIDLSGNPIATEKKEEVINKIKAVCGSCEIIW